MDWRSIDLGHVTAKINRTLLVSIYLQNHCHILPFPSPAIRFGNAKPSPYLIALKAALSQTSSLTCVALHLHHPIPPHLIIHLLPNHHSLLLSHSIPNPTPNTYQFPQEHRPTTTLPIAALQQSQQRIPSTPASIPPPLPQTHPSYRTPTKAQCL